MISSDLGGGRSEGGSKASPARRRWHRWEVQERENDLFLQRASFQQCLKRNRSKDSEVMIPPCLPSTGDLGAFPVGGLDAGQPLRAAEDAATHSVA